MQPHNNRAGPPGGWCRPRTVVLTVALVLCGAGFLWAGLPKVACAPRRFVPGAQQQRAPGAAPAGAWGAWLAAAEALLPLTNLSTLPSAALLDAAGNATRAEARQLRELMQLHQRLFCAAGLHKEPLPGASVAPVGNVSFYVYSSNDIVSQHLQGAGHAWETTEVQEILWALRQFRARSQRGTGLALPQAAGGTDDGSDEGDSSTSSGSSAEPERPLFVDVGANLGWHTIQGALAGARVAAYEAMPSNIALLRRSLCSSPWLMERVALFGTGLGTQRDTCFIISGTGNLGDGFTICDEQRARNTPGYEVRGMMTVRRLDSLLDEDVQVMKMDVEGYEQQVLEGATGLLARRRVSYLVAECNTGIIGEAAARAFIRYLDAHGFVVSPVSFKGPFWAPGQLANASCTNINLYARHKSLAA